MTSRCSGPEGFLSPPNDGGACLSAPCLACTMNHSVLIPSDQNNSVVASFNGSSGNDRVVFDWSDSGDPEFARRWSPRRALS